MAEEAVLEPPPTSPAEATVAPKKIKTTIPRTYQQINAAMERHRGDRKAAAKELEMSVAMLKNRIYGDHRLKSRWTSVIVAERNKAELKSMLEKLHDPATTVLEQLMVTASQDLLEQSRVTKRQMKLLEERINLADTARLLEDTPQTKEENDRFRKRHGVSVDDESKIRDNLNRLLEVQTKLVKSFADNSFTLVQARTLLTKAAKQEKEKMATDGLPRAVLGMMPKGGSVARPTPAL